MAMPDMKFTRKNALLLGLATWALLLVAYISNYNPIARPFNIHYEDYLFASDNSRLPAPRIDVRNGTIQRVVDELGIKDSRRLDSHSIIYDDILQSHDLISILSDLSFNQRCDLYFKNLYLHDNNWSIDPNERLGVDHRDQFSYNDYKNSILQQVREIYAEKYSIPVKDVKDNAELESMIRLEYERFWNQTMDIEQRITNLISHLRIFNKCYLTADENHQIISDNKALRTQKSLKSTSSFALTSQEKLIDAKTFSNCNELESRVYKWLSFAYPIYERWTGVTYLSPPDMKQFSAYPEVSRLSNPKFTSRTGDSIKSDFTNNQPCFLNRFKNSLNGRGIVLSISDTHVDDTVKLIHLLRALNNHYPIQIVYYDSLTIESKRKIVNAARSKMADLPASFQAVAHQFPKDYFTPSDGGLPKQEIWFVNTYNAIHDKYKDKFKGWFNKFLAALFNSFEEFMLIDADTVLLENPEYFFNLQQYINKGAYFYKDRTAAQFRPISDGKFFAKITPSIIDNLMFNIPIVTQYTLGRDLFDGMLHYMESGVVLINRRLHFNSILMMLQLDFFGAATERSHGDKELFWLGFAVNGDEDYHFNKNFAAAIGTLTPTRERLNDDGSPKLSQEICTAHPGHISETDNQLVWFNSGFQFCGQSEEVDYRKEAAKHNRFKTIKTPEALKEFYESPVSLTHAIIPPFKNKLSTYYENVLQEPPRGWFMDKQYCNSYLWCAYSSVGGVTANGEENLQRGQVFTFDKQRVARYKYLGDIWVVSE